MNISDYLVKHNICGCGKIHKIDIDKVIIGKDAIFDIPGIIENYRYKRIYLIADSNTYDVCGRKVEELLSKEVADIYTHVYDSPLVPDEKALGEFLANMKHGTDLILAVGSGTINDMCKYISHVISLPYFIVATAPSMDGYASDGAALIINDLKVTIPSTLPKVIIADTKVLVNAPYEMIASGFGDMVGKYSAINDWKLSAIINGEYYCTYIEDMVMTSLEKCIHSCEELIKRDEEAVGLLMESLILTGIAMSYAENSRPASGSEHHLSHYMELICLFSNRKCPPHGTKVGINTIITGKLRKFILDAVKDPGLPKAGITDETVKRNDILRVFGPAAKGIIEIMEKDDINEPDIRSKRMERIVENFESIREVLNEFPDEAEIIAILEKAGCRTKYDPAEISLREMKDGLLYAKEIRRRYTVLQLAEDLGLLEDFSLYNLRPY